MSLDSFDTISQCDSIIVIQFQSFPLNKRGKMSSLDGLIEKIEKECPDLITPEMLVKLGLADHVRLFRIRQNGEIPFLKLSSARILYLKRDVIEWLKRSYNDPKQDCLSGECSNDSKA